MQRALVALMGPSLSLIPTLGLFWFAIASDSAMAARVAFMFAIINAPNLLPLVPLDGGIILDALLRSAHARSRQAIAWLGVAAGLAFAVYLQSILIGIVFVFGGWQLVYRSSLEVNDKVEPLGRLQRFVLLAAFTLTIFAYWTILKQSYASPQVFVERADARHCRLPESCTARGTLVSRGAPRRANEDCAKDAGHESRDAEPPSFASALPRLLPIAR